MFFCTDFVKIFFSGHIGRALDIISTELFLLFDCTLPHLSQYGELLINKYLPKQALDVIICASAYEWNFPLPKESLHYRKGSVSKIHNGVGLQRVQDVDKVMWDKLELF